MGLTLHIFKKDARRLWWEITVTLGLLAALARMDCQRADSLPGPLEGVFNLLLPVAWCYLVALVIHQEAPVGDRQFWITRPYPPVALLAAKALFVAVFIHLTSLLGDVVVLLARGFQPLQYLPQLIWKQVLFAVTLTAPAAALAAVTGNLAQFASVGVLTMGSGVLLARSVEPFSMPWMHVDLARLGIASSVTAVAGIAILLLQYTRRRTTLARTMGIASLLLAGMLFAYVPRASTFALQCKLSEAKPNALAAAIRFAPQAGQLPPAHVAWSPANTTTVAIPLKVSGIPEGARARFEQLELEIVGPEGDRWKTAVQPRTGPRDKFPVEAYLSPGDQNTAWQIAILDRSVHDRIQGKKVRVTGKVGARFNRETAATQIALQATPAPVPGVGRCSSSVVSDFSARELLKVVCESPSPLPLLARVKLDQPDTGREWTQRLGDSVTHLPYPALTWVSPINRRTTFFHITDGPATAEGSRWLVPRDALSNVTLSVFGAEPTGCQILSYEIADIDLSGLVVRPTR